MLPETIFDGCQNENELEWTTPNSRDHQWLLTTTCFSPAVKLYKQYSWMALLSVISIMRKSVSFLNYVTTHPQHRPKSCPSGVVESPSERLLPVDSHTKMKSRNTRAASMKLSPCVKDFSWDDFLSPQIDKWRVNSFAWRVLAQFPGGLPRSRVRWTSKVTCLFTAGNFYLIGSRVFHPQLLNKKPGLPISLLVGLNFEGSSFVSISCVAQSFTSQIAVPCSSEVWETFVGLSVSQSRQPHVFSFGAFPREGPSLAKFDCAEW